MRLGWDVPDDAAGVWSLGLDGDRVPLSGSGSLDLGSGVQGLQLHQLGEQPQAFALEGNYPNPFNPAPTIRYRVPESGPVTLRVYDVAGQLVRELVSGWQPAGRHRVEWDGRRGAGDEVGGGVYLCELRAADRRAVQKMLLMK